MRHYYFNTFKNIAPFAQFRHKMSPGKNLNSANWMADLPFHGFLDVEMQPDASMALLGTYAGFTVVTEEQQ